MGLPKVKTTILITCHLTKGTCENKNHMHIDKGGGRIVLTGCLDFTKLPSCIILCCNIMGVRDSEAYVPLHETIDPDSGNFHSLLIWVHISFYKIGKWSPIMALSSYFWVSSSTWFNYSPHCWLKEKNCHSIRYSRRSRLTVILAVSIGVCGKKRELRFKSHTESKTFWFREICITWPMSPCPRTIIVKEDPVFLG